MLIMNVCLTIKCFQRTACLPQGQGNVLHVQGLVPVVQSIDSPIW